MTVFGSCYDPGLLTLAVFQDTVIGKCQTESYGFSSSVDNPCNTNSCMDVTKYIIYIYIYICVCIVGFVSKLKFSPFSVGLGISLFGNLCSFHYTPKNKK